MPWSLVHDGTVRDITFRKKQRQGDLVMYRVYVGDEEWGMVSWYHPRIGWTANSFNFPKGRSLADIDADEHDRSPRPDLALRSVRGFRTREAAATYIIKHHGHWKDM
jgi:hypothetical protein